MITYSITHGDTLSQFSIGPMNGSVIIQSPLNREAKDNYTLVLNATDGGGLYSNAILYVKVIDINDVRVGVVFMRHVTFLTCIAQNKNIC